MQLICVIWNGMHLQMAATYMCYMQLHIRMTSRLVNKVVICVRGRKSLYILRYLPAEC